MLVSAQLWRRFFICLAAFGRLRKVLRPSVSIQLPSKKGTLLTDRNSFFEVD